MGRHDSGGPNEAGPVVDLAAIVADDELLDALGRQHRLAQSGSGSTSAPAPSEHRTSDGSLAATAVPGTPEAPDLTDLFATWRAAIDADPVPEPPSVDNVVLGMRRAARRRSLRPVLGVAVAICALLVGSAAIGARTARPGDVLWPVTQILWSDRAESVVAGDTTRVALGQARMALDAGLTSEARSALVAASTVLPRVAERDGHEDLKKDMDNLWSTLDWVQRQRAVTVAAPAPAAPSPSWESGTEASTGTTVPSSPSESTVPSSKPPATSSSSGTKSPPSSASSAGTSTRPSSVPPPTSAPLPPGPPSSVAPPATSTVPTIPPTTVPTVPTVPSTPTSPAGPTPSTPTSPAPSTDTPTEPSASSSPSEDSTTAASATQEVLPIAPTEGTTGATVAQLGEQSIDPAQQVQQDGGSGTDGDNG